MTLRQIQYIAAVERLGSLSSAAKSLFISQSTLSFAIKDLETELGFTLFERTRTGMRPTESGRLFLQKARSALAAFSDLEKSVTDPRAASMSLRVVSVQSSFLAGVLGRIASEFESGAGQMRIKYKRCETGEVIDGISGEGFDVGFVYATDRQEQLWNSEFTSRGLETKRICSFEVCAIFSADDPKASRSSVSLSELSDYTFVYGGDDSLSGFSNLADYSAINFNLNEHRCYIDAQDTQLLNYLLRSPGRFSIGHRAVIPAYAAGLAYVPLRDRQFVHLLMLRRKGVPRSPYADRLEELLLETAADPFQPGQI